MTRAGTRSGKKKRAATRGRGEAGSASSSAGKSSSATKSSATSGEARPLPSAKARLPVSPPAADKAAPPPARTTPPPPPPSSSARSNSPPPATSAPAPASAPASASATPSTTTGRSSLTGTSSPTGKAPAPAPVTLQHEVEIAVCESSTVNQARARETISALGYPVADEITADAIAARRGRNAPDVVLVGLPEGQALLDSLAATDPRPILIAALAGPATSVRERAAAAGADLLVVRPHSKDSLAPALFAAAHVAGLRDRIRSLRSNEAVLRDRLARYGQADSATGFRHFDFFKQVLEMELKRAKRYGYSLAACLVAFDPWPTPPPAAALAKARTRIARAISASIRDIDLPVDLAEDRMLCFLPYTDLKGAEQVGRRIARTVADENEDPGTEMPLLSVSVGISALKPGKAVSFARLMRDATAALKAAQLKGGGRVVVRT